MRAFVHKLTILPLLAATLACASQPSPAPASRGPASAPTVLTLEPYVMGLSLVRARVGSETLPFLLDTGGGITLVTPEVAKKAGCEPFGRITGFRAVGERLDSPRCGPIEISLGPVSVRTEVAVFDLSALLEGAPPVGGLIALPSFEGNAITLDLAGQKLILETPESLAERVRSMSPLTVRPGRQAGGAALDLFLAIQSPQGPLWLEVDSGNAGPVQLSPHALRQLGIDIPKGKNQSLRLDVAGLGLVEVETAERDLIYDGLLNAAFLRKMVLTVDLGSMRAWGALAKP